MSAAVGGLRPRGRMIVVGASADPMQIPPFALIPGSTGVIGHASGTSKDSEDTLRFSALRHPPADRDVPARAGGRGLRADDERRRALPRRAHDDLSYRRQNARRWTDAFRIADAGTTPRS